MGSGDSLRRLIGAIILVLAGGAAMAATCSGDMVHLRGPDGEAAFRVEVADTEAERAQGLMHRESMARSAGMLFVYEKPQVVRFWMKNTLIPLDMIFADVTGTVRRVHHMARPHSEKLIPGGSGIKYVLEINGGLAEQLGIGEGSQLRHPAIEAAKAAWAC